MDTITIVSSDGETSVKIIKNWNQEGRPAIIVSSFDVEGNAIVTEMPLDPGVVMELVNLFQGAEHYMLRFLCQHVAAQEVEEDVRPNAPVLSIFKEK